ncbi:folate-binding protein [Dyella sp. A6]|uniref:CAF17-like 4Fe-4S cluster assembly/insertion protein YgfZ n=1 Tax=Dyella aluminiiresistens TaxID=3069105 RepID=UPI002E75D9CA|nr:folate-binding protein [Dyella sp. A6]
MTSPHSAQTISIEGIDAIAFAQSQFSSNVLALRDGQWQFSAWLDAQGRVRALFHLARIHEHRLVALLRGGDATRFATELQRFVFRSRVKLLPSQQLPLGSASSMPMFDAHEDESILHVGCGDHSLICGKQAPTDDSWREKQLREGWAWLPDTLTGCLLPPALSLYRLSAVALDKGCYPGQEIVSRLHYRSGHKRHLHRVKLSQVMQEGSTLHAAGHEAVWLLQTLPREPGSEALAVISDAVAEQVSSDAEHHLDESTNIIIQASWGD